MASVFVIHDKAMKVDVFSFMQTNAGAAGSYFYNWVLMQGHTEFSLFCVCDLSYSEDSGVYVVDDISRRYICDMPEDLSDD